MDKKYYSGRVGRVGLVGWCPADIENNSAQLEMELGLSSAIFLYIQSNQLKLIVKKNSKKLQALSKSQFQLID